MPQRRMPKFVWVSTRRTAAVVDCVAEYVDRTYLLHTFLHNQTWMPEEFASTELVVMEIPPVTLSRFEHDLLRVVRKIRTAGTHVLILVQPSLRKRTQRSLWIHRCNLLDYVPFRFQQMCSCQLGDTVPGCHYTYYVGAAIV